MDQVADEALVASDSVTACAQAACAGGLGSAPLDSDEDAAWKAVAAIFLLLPGVLDAQLQRDAGLSVFEFLVLNALATAPARQLRMGELAARSNASASRLCNVVNRLEQRGWVRREADTCDGRSTHAILTDAGHQVVVAATPGHLAAVRSYLLDPLTPSQIQTLRKIGTRLLPRLNPAGAPASRAS